MKKVLVVMMAVMMIGVFALTGCQSSDNGGGEAAGNDKEILVTSFGTSFDSSRNITIGGVESAIRESFPEWDVERAFTAQIIIDKLAKEEDIKINNFEDGIKAAEAAGVKTLVVQPTHLMAGLEYDDVKKVIDENKDKFDKVVLADPLLTSDDDFDKVSDIMIEKTKQFDDGKTAIVYMGHGTEHESNAVYAKMHKLINGKNKNYFVGTVEATPSLDDVVKEVKAGNYKKVVLLPMMVVAGDHANNDMAGDEDDSWKSTFEKEGFEVEAVLEGLGQNSDIQKIYVEHCQKAVDEA
jgi:sirohydrochlorin cobaltochelatase